MTMLDWIIVACLVVGGLRGLRRGLIRSFLGLAGLIIGLFLATEFYRPLSQYLETQYSVISRIAAGIAPHLPLAAPVASTPPGQGAAFPDAVRGLGLPDFVTKYLLSATQHAPNLPGVETVGQAVAALLASAIVGLLCFAGILLVAQIAAALLASVIAGAVSVTPLGLLDHLAGLAVGAAYAAVILSLLLGGLSLFTSVPTFAFLRPFLQNSRLAPGFVSFFQYLLPRVPTWFGGA